MIILKALLITDSRTVISRAAYVRFYSTQNLSWYSRKSSRSLIQCTDFCISDRQNGGCVGFEWSQSKHDCYLYSDVDANSLSRSDSVGSRSVYALKGRISELGMSMRDDTF